MLARFWGPRGILSLLPAGGDLGRAGQTGLPLPLGKINRSCSCSSTLTLTRSSVTPFSRPRPGTVCARSHVSPPRVSSRGCLTLPSPFLFSPSAPPPLAPPSSSGLCPAPRQALVPGTGVSLQQSSRAREVPTLLRWDPLDEEGPGPDGPGRGLGVGSLGACLSWGLAGVGRPREACLPSSWVGTEQEPHSVRTPSAGPADLRAHGNLSPKCCLERQRPPGSGAQQCLLRPTWWQAVL